MLCYSAIEFLKQCELLKIEDLIPFFPDFVVIDDFKVGYRCTVCIITNGSNLGGNMLGLGRVQ